jgi:hypothetical protein
MDAATVRFPIGVVSITDRKGPTRMKRFLPLIASALGWLACGGHAHADPMPAPNATWSYNFSPVLPTTANPGNQTAFSGTPPVANPESILASDGKSGVSIVNQQLANATGPSDVVATTISGFSGSSSNVGFGSGGNYAFSLVLTDGQSNATATYTFQGQFGGTLSATNSNITSTITGGTVTTSNGTVSFSGANAPTVALGNYDYTVSMGSYTPPGPPSENLTGSIGGFVNVTTLGTASATTPEPSALLLSGVGLSFAGIVSWRKRRQRLAANLA